MLCTWMLKSYQQLPAFTWRAHRKTRLRHMTPVAMKSVVGFFWTQDMWIGCPFLLSLDLPLQCKSALTSAAGLLECVLPMERARTMQWHGDGIFQRIFMLLTMNSSTSRGSKLWGYLYPPKRALVRWAGDVPTTQTGRWVKDFNGIAWSASFRTVILPTWISFPYSKITFAKMISAWKTIQRMLNKQNKTTTKKKAHNYLPWNS